MGHMSGKDTMIDINLSDEKINVLDVINSGSLSQGEWVGKFERKLADYLDVDSKYVVATSSGTAALHLAVELLYPSSVKRDLKVPAITFIATSNAIRYSGHIPYFVDIDHETWNSIFEEGVQVDLYGCPCEPKAPIIDSCESLGATYNGRKCGTIAWANCLSFFANKPITTGGEGGALIIKSKLADDARRMRTQGKLFGEPHHTYPGYNYRMTEVQAAYGVAQLDKLDKIIDAKRKIHNLYLDYLGDSASFQQPLKGTNPSWFLTGIKFKSPIERAKAEMELSKRSISYRPIFEPPRYPTSEANCIIYPNAEELYQHGLCLPSDPKELNEDDIKKISKIILKCVK